MPRNWGNWFVTFEVLFHTLHYYWAENIARYAEDVVKGSRDGAVVRALASHQCVPGSIPGPGVICEFEFVVGSRPCSEGFSQGSPVFLPP